MSNIEVSPSSDDRSSVLATFCQVLQAEASSILAGAQRSGLEIELAVQRLIHLKGRVIFTGMGKAGYIARKAAATFCSTGTPAIFLHPGEALHGDLGIVTSDDLMIAISNSGETAEVIQLLPFMARMEVPVIAITGNLQSSLALRSAIVIDASVTGEADPISVAPTSSTTLALAICDGLAVSLMVERGFTREQFAIFHPGGSLGRKLLLQVQDLMRVGDSLPIIESTARLSEAMKVISAKKMGAVLVVDQGRLLGILTDGDLRRIFQDSSETRLQTSASSYTHDPLVADVMTCNPQRVTDIALAAEALKKMEDFQITVLPVVRSSDASDDQQVTEQDADQVVGAIHLHDLIRAGLA